jgi:antitoxin (DNA-binding transcriptional repressor) of toxin-antitoxin stability system
MNDVPASYAKQNFGDVLGQAALAPVGIRKHGRLVAALVPPEFLARSQALDERHAARAAQRQVELARLAAHQRLGIELLCAPALQQRRVIDEARHEVARWQDKRLCSPDYIERWRAWLALPVKELVQRMCSPADGWGNAMRQNTPFILAAPQTA